MQIFSICTLVGCDSDVELEEDERIPIRHAEVRAAYHGDLTVITAREATLLHPQSDRQRHAREQLLYLEKIDDRIFKRADYKTRESEAREYKAPEINDEPQLSEQHREVFEVEDESNSDQGGFPRQHPPSNDSLEEY